MGQRLSPSIGVRGVVQLISRPVPDKPIESLSHLPVWLFHGDADRTVGVQGSKAVYKACIDCASRSACTKLHILPGAKHTTSWKKVYGDSTAFEWLLKHRNSGRCSGAATCTCGEQLLSPTTIAEVSSDVTSHSAGAASVAPFGKASLATVAEAPAPDFTSSIPLERTSPSSVVCLEPCAPSDVALRPFAAG